MEFEIIMGNTNTPYHLGRYPEHNLLFVSLCPLSQFDISCFQLSKLQFLLIFSRVYIFQACVFFNNLLLRVFRLA